MLGLSTGPVFAENEDIGQAFIKAARALEVVSQGSASLAVSSRGTRKGVDVAMAFIRAARALDHSSADEAPLVTASINHAKQGARINSAKEKLSVKSAKKTVGKPVRKPARKRGRKKAATRLVAKIDLTSQTMKVLVDGKLKYKWQISSGRKGYHTPTGSYKPYYINKMHYSKKYDNAPMPHSVFYSGGFAVHGTYAVRRLGTPASHGCTRLAPANARKFFNLVKKYKKAGTRIMISGRTPAYTPRKHYARKKNIRRSNKSWKKSGFAGSNYLAYNVRQRNVSNTRRIRIGNNRSGAGTKSYGKIFNWKF